MSDLVVNDYLAPIQGEDQAGSDAKYDSAYEALESEVKKFGSLFDEVVDWSRVEKHSIEILTLCSKDIKVACYLCRAWTEKQEFAGMQEGLELVSGLLQTYGSQLFPRRQRAREGAFEWLESQLKNIASKLPVNSGCKSQISSCRELISTIQGQFESLHSGTNVSLLSIQSLLDDAVRQLEVDGIDEAEGSDQSEHGQAQQQVRQTEQKSISDNSEQTFQYTKIAAEHESKTPSNNYDVELSGENIEFFKQPLKKAAQAFLNADIGLSIAYRINRHISWFEILELPQHGESGQTDLHLAVSDDSQQEYRDLAETGGSIELIRKLENILLDIPFWLTGHFYLGKALINHGYTDVAESVKQELQLFTKRLSGIEKLKFKNGTPFACSDTQKWIINESNETKHIVPDSPAVSEIDPSLAHSPKVSLDSFGHKVTDMSKQLGAELSGRSQFLLYLNMIRAFHGVGLYSLCLPYLETVWQIRERMNLSQWEPQLCLLLDPLTDKTLSELFSNDRAIPEKYKAWVSVYC